jgi:hypothetical protein
MLTARKLRLSRLAVTIPFLCAAAAASAQETSCAADLAAYSKLRDGMSYRQAVSTIGCDGSELSSSEIGGTRTVMYAWSGRGMLGANMNAMFQDDRLVMKAQFGLK